MALWSLFTGLTPQAAAGGTANLLSARVLLGIGEGVAFPAVHALIGERGGRACAAYFVLCVLFCALFACVC